MTLWHNVIDYSDPATARRLTLTTSLSTRQPRPDRRNLNVESWYRPADHPRATHVHPRRSRT